MIGWEYCPRCAGTGFSKDGRECGLGRFFRPRSPLPPGLADLLIGMKADGYRCRLCGLGGDLERSPYGWVHAACLMADDSETDYEALGYPETDVAEFTTNDHVAARMCFWVGVWSARIG